MPLLHNYEGSK